MSQGRLPSANCLAEKQAGGGWKWTGLEGNEAEIQGGLSGQLEASLHYRPWGAREPTEDFVQETKLGI